MIKFFHLFVGAHLREVGDLTLPITETSGRLIALTDLDSANIHLAPPPEAASSDFVLPQTRLLNRNSMSRQSLVGKKFFFISLI